MPQIHRSPLLALSHIWQAYSQLGVKHLAEDPISRRIVLTNRVAAVVFVLGVWMAAYFLQEGFSTITLYWFVFLIGTVFIMPILNAFGHTYVSRHMLSSLMPLFIIAIVAHARLSTPNEVHEASFYIPRFFLTAISFFPLLLFSPTERLRMYVSFGSNIIILLFFNELLSLFGAGMGLLEPQIKDAFFISVTSVISLVIIASGFFFLNQLNHNYELRIGELLAETESKNRHINAGINYAKNIQQVVLPPKETLTKLNNQLFVFYRPLDVVSGDFYLVEESVDTILFAVIDCTGHGVPGAFMSILANSALQRSISLLGYSNPAAIMSSVNQLFHEDLNRSGNPDIKDGMDMAICSWNKKSHQLLISGANLHIILATDKGPALHYCDKGSISIGNPERIFTNTAFQLQPSDMVYVSSDGFADQFGGQYDKRMGKRGVASALCDMAQLPVLEQQAAIAALFDTWKGTADQVDDVCLIGFRGL